MEIAAYFKQAIEKNASDLHLVAGSIPVLRKHGDLVKLDDSIINDEELKKSIKDLVNSETWERFENDREFDFAQEFFGTRFRVNLHYQENKIGLSARLIPEHVPGPESIGLNDVIYNLTHLHDGLIIVTGPTGSGKSTTLASMIDIINRERRAHIITIEDPIEYLFKEKQCIIEQRELGSDTKSFSSALKYALRQDPNVIMVGEMRDAETMSAVLTAAETGHLVLSTLHTPSAPETIARIIDIFPSHRHQQILNQLSSILRAVIAQQLLPTIDRKRVAVREIMINNNAVANLIRTNQMGQLYTAIQTGKKDGMITMNKSIDMLLKEGIISEDVARNRIRDLETKAVYY